MTSELASNGNVESPSAPPKGHPKGLWVLFITEMWERFSYYGMRALLVLYLIETTAAVLPSGEPNKNPGFGWAEGDAYLLYGLYTWAVYLTPLLGGWLADRYLGTHRSMLFGGWIIAAGHVTLAATELFAIKPGEVVARESAPAICFLSGLLLIVMGTGFFKPCVSVMVGQLYERDDPRKDAGFTIFYMGINLGAFFSPLVAGTLGQEIGWHWGFGSAAVGMVTGLLFYQRFRPRYLGDIGDPPRRDSGYLPAILGAAFILGIALLGWRIGPWLLTWFESVKENRVFWSIVCVLGLAAIGVFLWRQRPGERGGLGAIFVLAFIGNIFFWTAFEQAGSSMNVFAEKKTYRPLWLPEWFRQFCTGDNSPLAWWMAVALGVLLLVPLGVVCAQRQCRTRKFIAASTVSGILGILAIVFGVLRYFGELETIGAAHEFPASWYQSVNPLGILLFGPVFAAMWLWLERRKIDPPTPMKFALGLYLLGLAFLAMVAAAFETQNGKLAGPHWLLLTYLVVTWGELCLSPVGLSMITKLAPQRLQSLMMGIWFFSFSLSNLIAGYVAKFSKTVESGDVTFVYPGLPGFFLMLVVCPIGAGVVLTLLTPVLRRMMGGVR